MPQFIRHHVNVDSYNMWALPILAGLLVGCLLAFIASFYLMETRWASSAATTAFAASTVPESKPASEFRKPVRYEAIKANWAKYRSANHPKN